MTKKTGTRKTARTNTFTTTTTRKGVGTARSKTRGRPLGRTYPPRINATPEEIAARVLGAKPNPVLKVRAYHCAVCERVVAYPETLYEDGRCETCHALPA
ncbi:MAG: hypothetical protein OXC99_01145 [Chloroflexi bacterium]|nr:hypothetical protein [Chloroflexota bacterium]